MPEIRIPNLCRDQADGQIGGAEQALCLLHFLLNDIILQVHAGLFLKKPGHVIRIQVDSLGQFFPAQLVFQILDDPHVKEREMFVEMDHPTLGKVTVNGCAIKLMDTKPSVRTPAPQLGQNNRDIFEGVLGMTEEQFNTLHEKQVF